VSTLLAYTTACALERKQSIDLYTEASCTDPNCAL